MKRKFIELIGNQRYGYDGVSEELLERKVFYCRELLQVQSVLSPGLSEYRAYISLHLAETLYWAHKRDIMPLDLPFISELLLIVIDIWGQYRNGSTEKSKASEAEDILQKLKNSMEDSDVSKNELGMRKLA